MTSFGRGNTMKFLENPLSECRIDLADVHICCTCTHPYIHVKQCVDEIPLCM